LAGFAGLSGLAVQGSSPDGSAASPDWPDTLSRRDGSWQDTSRTAQQKRPARPDARRGESTGFAGREGAGRPPMDRPARNMPVPTRGHANAQPEPEPAPGESADGGGVAGGCAGGAAGGEAGGAAGGVAGGVAGGAALPLPDAGAWLSPPSSSS